MDFVPLATLLTLMMMALAHTGHDKWRHLPRWNQWGGRLAREWQAHRSYPSSNCGATGHFTLFYQLPGNIWAWCWSPSPSTPNFVGQQADWVQEIALAVTVAGRRSRILPSLIWYEQHDHHQQDVHGPDQQLKQIRYQSIAIEMLPAFVSSSNQNASNIQ